MAYLVLSRSISASHDDSKDNSLGYRGGWRRKRHPTASLLCFLKSDILKRHKIIRMTGQRILLDEKVNALEAHLAQ